MPTFFAKQKFFGWGAGFSNPEQFKFGDFNGDGNLDLFVARIGSDLGTTAEPQQVYIGDGKGNFSDETSSLFKSGAPYANYAARTVIADLNSDGASDIFIIDSGIDKPPFSGGQNKLFLSSSNRQLIDSTNSLPQSLHMNHGSSVADVNQDGRQDILVNALMSSGNDLQIQDAAGRFISSPSLMPNLTDTTAQFSRVFTNTWSALIDINNDKYPDMILGKWDNDSSPKFNLVYLSKTGSYANSASINLPISGVNFEIVLDIKPIDLNGDNLPDLALSISNGNGGDSKLPYYQTAYVQLLVNAGNGQFRDETFSRLPQDTTIKTYQTWYKSIEVVDINHDGFSDMVLEDYHLGSKLMLNDGKGKFNEISLVDGSAGYQRSVVGDINKDGMSDLILSNTWTGFDVYENSMSNGHIYKANFGGETLLGSNQSDRFISSNGNDTLNGGDGIDTAVYAGNRSNYTLTKGASTYIVSDKTGADGTDTLTNIERLVFSDFKEALGTTALNESEVQKLYIAYFNRPGDPGGLGYWEGLLANGASMTTLQNSFSSSAEYQAIYIGQQNTVLITKLYQNLFGRVVDVNDGGVQWWAGEMAAGRHTITTIAGALSSGTTPGSADNIAITNKITAATAFTNALNTNAETENYVGTAAFAIASNWLAPIRDDNILATSLASRDATIASAVAAKTVLVNATGTANASQGVVTFELATASFDYTISGFGVGDRIDFATGAAPTLTNASNSDGQVNLIWSAGGNNVVIQLVGLSGTQDSQLNTLADFNTVFGVGSVY